MKGILAVEGVAGAAGQVVVGVRAERHFRSPDDFEESHLPLEYAEVVHELALVHQDPGEALPLLGVVPVPLQVLNLHDFLLLAVLHAHVPVGSGQPNLEILRANSCTSSSWLPGF